MLVTLERNATSILLSLGFLLVSLILLFGILHLAANKAPNPISSIADKVSSLATPAGWSTNS